MRNNKLTGLYAITDAQQTDQQKLIADVEQALLGGARIIQYRDKSQQYDQRRNTAQQLRALTHQHNALLIINDDVQLAKDSNADGVHLGRDDQTVATARATLGPAAIIGVSCYNDFSLAQQAEKSGIDYIAFGRFFTSRTKPEATPATTDILKKAKLELDIPVIAIGGITTENGKLLIDAGAQMLAVVDGLFAQQDIMSTAQQFQALFKATSRKK